MTKERHEGRDRTETGGVRVGVWTGVLEMLSVCSNPMEFNQSWFQNKMN